MNQFEAMRLKNRIAVVTGSGKGIGKAIAIRLASEGAKVVIAEKDPDTGNAIAQKIQGFGGQALFKCTDVTNEESIKGCMSAAVQQFGAIHILVNNAGINLYGHLMETGTGSGSEKDRQVTPDMWNSVLKTNLIGAADCIKHVLPIMSKNKPFKILHTIDDVKDHATFDAGYRGSIINISSIQGILGLPEFVAYAATKGGLSQVTRSCATDFAKLKIRVNAVCPGAIETPLMDEHREMLGLSNEEGRLEMAKGIPLQRIGAPQEIAGAVAFLASDDSSFMTGAEIVVDGGQVII